MGEARDLGQRWFDAVTAGDADAAVALLLRAADLGLNPRGTTFHVGSQCRTSASWDAALARTSAPAQIMLCDPRLQRVRDRDI